MAHSDPSLDRLVAGFRVFRAKYFDQRPMLYTQLITRGQEPDVLVVACSDSRVDPAILLNVEPGELFVVRNVANLVPPYEPDGHYHGTSAAVEFGVLDLKVRHIIVLGHSRCSGIGLLHRRLKGEAAQREFVAQWMSLVVPLQGHAPCACDQEPDSLGQAAIRASLSNLRGFPWVVSACDEGRLALHGWWFDLDKGALLAVDKATGQFNPLS